MIDDTQIIMGMPVTVKIAGKKAAQNSLDLIFDYFKGVDDTFSTYKKDSEISKFNRKEIARKNLSLDVRLVLNLSEQTKRETKGYFDIQKKDGTIDPSGLVKGWAIFNAANLLKKKGFNDFYIDAGGDIQISGLNENRKLWRIGIRNPFNVKEIIKVLSLTNLGVATSGNYERGNHVYDPVGHKVQEEIISITVVGSNVYEADRFATAAFAMGKKGIEFIESKKDLEGYMIDKEGIATMTPGFTKYVKSD